MFDDVTIRASDRQASQRFYETVLRPLGVGMSASDDYVVNWNDFSLVQATDADPPTRRLHIAFVAPTREHVDAFWRIGTGAGYQSDGEPGPRPQYRDDYYGSFLLDPDGNSAEAVNHGAMRTGGIIDHLWIRVGGLDASKAFYEAVGRDAGFRLLSFGGEPHRAQFGAGNGSFSVVDDGPPAQQVRIAFRRADAGAKEFRDPDGNRVDLIAADLSPAHTRCPPAAAPRAGP